MKNLDYIVVGCGLAGIAILEVLKANKKSFKVIDNASQQSSLVAAGLYNPVVLKRFTKVWKAQEQLNSALPSYKQIEDKLNVKVDYQHPIYRRFNSVEEQNMWFTAADKPSLEPFLSTTIVKNKNPFVDADLGLGEVYQTGHLDTKKLIDVYKADLSFNSNLTEETFDYSALEIHSDHVIYNEFKAKAIIFAEGFGVKNNPFFSDIPLTGTKGEVLTIKAPALQLNEAIKSSVFIIPIGDDYYRVGATYEWSDKTNTATEKAKSELISKLKAFIKCDFEIVDHKAGVRPTTKDRRPIVGQHQTHLPLYILNGLGSRGVMVGPYVAKQLYNLITNEIPLESEIDIKRFQS